MIVEFVSALLLLLLLPLVYAVYVLGRYVVGVYNLKNYPPGPFPLPFFGSLHLMKKPSPIAYSELSKIYGDVFSITMGMERVVVVNTIAPALEALVKQAETFAGRNTNNFQAYYMSRGFRDLAFADYNPIWKIARKTTVSALKMHGDNNDSLQRKIMKEAELLSQRLGEKIGQPVNLEGDIGITVMNFICSTTFGFRYDIESPEFKEILELNALLQRGYVHGDPVSFLPWLRYLYAFESFECLKSFVSRRDRIMRKNLVNHRSTYDPENMRDLTDSLIKYSEEKDLWKNAIGEKKTDDYLEVITSEVFTAGWETTTATVRWCVLYLLHSPPKLQDDLYKEIVDAAGADSYPDLNDRSSTPLLQATIQETLRLSSVSPTSIPRKTIRDTTLDGDFIPKGTQVVFNTWNMHRDEKEYDQPLEFNPHRWLDENGAYNPRKHRSLLPFSAGKRVCPGESVARSETYLIVSRLFKDFKFEVNPNDPLPSKDGNFGFLLVPPPYTVLLKPRGKVV